MTAPTGRLARVHARLAIRPALDDVERLARGGATRRRGVGSRRVPHRLNREELELYQLAVRKGFALLEGSGHRVERGGAPLLNTLRQRADALATPLVWVERHRTGSLWHTNIDYSPVRCLGAQHLWALHELTLRTVAEVDAAPCVVTMPASDELGARAVLPSEDDSRSQPIWRLPSCVARFGFAREDEQRRRACKRLAEALSRASWYEYV